MINTDIKVLQKRMVHNVHRPLLLWVQLFRCFNYSAWSVAKRGDNKNRKGRMKMKYQIEENCLTIFLPKELDHHQTEEIRREADRQIERNHVKYVIFDFGETSFMDSSGIGVMMGRYRKLSLTGGEVWAANLNERMKKILKMSGAAKIIRIYEEERK